MKKTIKILLIGAILSLVSVTSTFASDKITNVNVSISNDDSVMDGYVNPVDVSSSQNTSVSARSFSSDYDDWRPGKKVTAYISIAPDDGYSFSKKDTKVSVSGGDINTTEISSDEIRIRVSFPVRMKLAAPTNIYFEDAYTAVWDKVEYAKQYEVEITSMDDDGKTTRKTTKVDENSIDLSSYATNDYDISFKVRALPSDNNKQYIKDSEWTSSNDTVSASEDNSAYGVLEGSGNRTKFNIGYDDGADKDIYATGWVAINGLWYYFDKETQEAKTGWNLINNVWYYMDTNTAIMATGWIKLDNKWYFLNSSGAMLTGWIEDGPNGKWYCLSPDGSMYADMITPDGYSVGKDGAWIH